MVVEVITMMVVVVCTVWNQRTRLPPEQQLVKLCIVLSWCMGCDCSGGDRNCESTMVIMLAVMFY